MGQRGLEPGSVTTSKSKGLEQPAESRAAESDASGPDSAPIDTDLARVIDAWPGLPEAVKAGIKAMVKAATGGAGDEG
jgi:hypothetical protein